METTEDQACSTSDNDKTTAGDNSSELDIVSEVTDPFAYLEGGFTSEKFKIEIRNLPKFYGLKELKKFLNNKLNLGCNKIKIPSKGSYWIYVCFRSEEDQKKAIETLDGYKWKGKVLSADKAKAVPDPLIKKRMLRKSLQEGGEKRLKIANERGIENVNDVVTPYWKIPYEEQLTKKEEATHSILKSLGDELIKVNPELADFFKSQQNKFNGLPCELLPIRHAELPSDGYRNKCEFTIGINEATGLRTVGFRMGSYSAGSLTVAPIDDALNVPARMKKAVSVFEKFVRSSDLDVYKPVTQEGHWRQLTARYGFRTDQLMLIIGIHPQNLTEEEMENLTEEIKKFFTSGEGKSCNVYSLFLQTMYKKKSPEDEPIYYHILGETHIYEKLLNRSFRISPQAFFQINTDATEVLYQSIADISGLNEDVALLDICCGTGSIGICLSDKCGEVLGLEISSEAIGDAKENAEANDIKNTQFFVGKAEDILTSVARRASKTDIVAIADPPRAGLHQNALVQLRKSSQINKLVYVSCDPKLALKNFIALGRPTSKMYLREPFIPLKAIPVDLFPYTKHCELLVYFERAKRDVIESHDQP